MRNERTMVLVPAQLNCFTITISFLFVLLAGGFRDAGADIPGQGETGPMKEGNPVSSSMNTEQYLSSASSTEESKAVSAPQPETKTPPEEDEPDINPCANLEVSGETWLDQTHDYVERNICRPSVWFDHFFGDYRLLEDVRPGTFVKLRNAVRWTEGGYARYLFDYHLQWQLPQWKRYLKKARIYFDSGSEAVKYTTQPGQPIEPGVDPATGVRKPILGLRVDLYTRLRSLVSIESGGNLNIHPNAFIRLRYEYSKSFRRVYLIRFSQIAMWQVIEHFTDTTQFSLERTITTFTLVRWGNNMTYTQGSNGVTWNTGISFITQLTPRSAISYDTSMWGVNYPEWTITNYRVGSKYRRNFYRPWLFFEIDPELTLPIKEETGKRNSVYAFMVTLEIQFGQ